VRLTAVVCGAMLPMLIRFDFQASSRRQLVASRHILFFLLVFKIISERNGSK
jgi:hypothetical protein